MLRTGQHDADRFDRSKRIEWMDIDRIHRTRCLVVGAGALGNEVVKNMVLSGFRDITVVDMDSIVRSNLNRCVFFRDDDIGGAMKADIVAERASELDPNATITPMPVRIQDIDTWDFDIVMGCLDNISARLHVNAHCRYHNIPYVDGATDGFRGKVHVVLDGPCLQCMMNRTHAKVADKRFSCTGSQHNFIPKMAAEITTTSVIAAMQVREAVKIASGREEMCIRDVAYYDGISGEMEILRATIDPGCTNHTETSIWE